MEFTLNKEKAVNTLLYVVSKLEKADFHKTFKIIYFADQFHLQNYGRPIAGDLYIKMDFGPVPSFIRDITQNNITEYEGVVQKYGKNFLKTVQVVDLDALSESEMECLDSAIDENKNLSFGALTKKSHDYAWQNTTWHISHIDMLKSVSDDTNLLEYVQHQILNDSIHLV
jgi:uncharacterized phage-associated protein